MSLLLALLGLTPPIVGNQLKYWDGSTWTSKPLKYWDGSAWQVQTLSYWNGNSWI